jgi:hypothetical protein
MCCLSATYGNTLTFGTRGKDSRIETVTMPASADDFFLLELNFSYKI